MKIRIRYEDSSIVPILTPYDYQRILKWGQIVMNEHTFCEDDRCIAETEQNADTFEKVALILNFLDKNWLDRFMDSWGA